MDPNRAAADMIKARLPALQHEGNLREALARRMLQPDPVRVSELLEADSVECSPARVRAELRSLCYRASWMSWCGSDSRRLVEGRGAVTPPMALGGKFARRRAA